MRESGAGGDLMEVTVRPIHNNDDYEVALVEVDTLMEAQPGTPEGARLDVLATLIEAYERRHWAIDAPDPVSIQPNRKFSG